MKALVHGVSVVLLFGASMVSQAQDAEVATESPALARVPAALARDVDVDESILSEVIKHMDRHLQQTPLALRPFTRSGADSLVGESEVLAANRPPQAVCLIGLIAYGNDLKTFGAVVPESKAGVINVSALAQGAESDPALLAKRVSKEAVHAALLLNGMKPCPNPRCALFTAPDVQQIDQKGFGPCPPCLYRYLDKTEEAGVTVRPLGS